jgi:hypothetical protein
LIAVGSTVLCDHHGASSGSFVNVTNCSRTTPSRSTRRTLAWARASIEAGIGLLARGELAGFLEHAARAKSDFRDPGVVLAALLERPFAADVLALALVEYASVLEASEPTWVAGALVRVRTVSKP